MELLVRLNCWVKEVTAVSFQKIIDFLGILTNVISPLLKCSCRVLFLLVAVHNHDIISPHLRRICAVICNIAVGPQRLPRIRGNLCRLTVCCTLRCTYLKIGTRLRNTLNNHIREVVHIDNEVHYGMNRKTYSRLVVLIAVADNLQRLLDLNISIVVASCYRLQICVEVKLMPICALEVTTILTVPSKVIRSPRNILVNILLYQAKSLWIVVLCCYKQNSLIIRRIPRLYRECCSNEQHCQYNLFHNALILKNFL